MSNKKVNNCVIMKQEIEGQEHLVAYIETLDDVKEELITECKKRLRSYMVPTIWIMMDKFKLNKNGKVDRKQLPKPELEHIKEIVLPTNRMEEDLLIIWKEVFNKNDIGITHDFFMDLEGNSIIGMTLLSKLKKHFGKKIRISFNDILEYNTIQTFSNYISKL